MEERIENQLLHRLGNLVGERNYLKNPSPQRLAFLDEVILGTRKRLHRLGRAVEAEVVIGGTKIPGLQPPVEDHFTGCLERAISQGDKHFAQLSVRGQVLVVSTIISLMQDMEALGLGAQAAGTLMQMRTSTLEPITLADDRLGRLRRMAQRRNFLELTVKGQNLVNRAIKSTYKDCELLGKAEEAELILRQGGPIENV